MLDSDCSGVVEPCELSVVVSPKERDQMMAILDTDGNNEVSPEEWLVYIALKKHEKGGAKFKTFLDFLEKRVMRVTADVAGKAAIASGSSVEEVASAAGEAAARAGANTEERAQAAGEAAGAAVIASGGSKEEASKAAAKAAAAEG